MAESLYDEQTLQVYKYACLHYLPAKMAESFAMPAKAEVSLHDTFFADRIALRLTQRILGEELERISYRYPANWIEAVKERWLPWWLRKRWR